MAQMAPALAEAAGSPSTNGNISSSSSQNPLREPYVEEGITIDNSKLQINSTTPKQNGFCRSMANSNINSTVGKRVLDEVHKFNNLPRAFSNATESTKSGKINSQEVPLASVGESASTMEQTRPISTQKESLTSTPTRIRITTTKTCGSNSLENRSSCPDLYSKTNDESQQRYLFSCPEPSPRLLLEKKVKKAGLNQVRLSTRARKLERRLRTLQSRQLETHVTDQLQTFAVNRRKAQLSISQQKYDQTKSDLTLRQPSRQLKEETSCESTSKSVGRVGEELPLKASLGTNINDSHTDMGGNNIRTGCADALNPVNDKETEGNAAKSLVCQLELAEHVGDSDATECSSGAESCDEMDCNPGSSEARAKG